MADNRCVHPLRAEIRQNRSEVILAVIYKLRDKADANSGLPTCYKKLAERRERGRERERERSMRSLQCGICGIPVINTHGVVLSQNRREKKMLSSNFLLYGDPNCFSQQIFDVLSSKDVKRASCFCSFLISSLEKKFSKIHPKLSPLSRNPNFFLSCRCRQPWEHTF